MGFGCDGGLGSYGGVDGVDGVDGTGVEALLVPMMVASMDGFERWRRWVASMVVSMDGVDGGLGFSTQRALTWKSLCVPSSEGDTHSGSLLFV